jgi:hypothetical protein
MANVNITNPMSLIGEPINRNNGDPKGYAWHGQTAKTEPQ